MVAKQKKLLEKDVVLILMNCNLLRVKTLLTCCLLLLYEYDGECRGLSLEDDMINQPRR